jgi:hypothetical protein
MLSKKQLEDAAKCPYIGYCVECSMKEVQDKAIKGCLTACNSASAKTALTYRAMLERVIKDLNDAVRLLRRYNINSYIEKSHTVVDAQNLLKEV